jgi:hypothetical protein
VTEGAVPWSKPFDCIDSQPGPLVIENVSGSPSSSRPAAWYEFAEPEFASSTGFDVIVGGVFGSRNGDATCF